MKKTLFKIRPLPLMRKLLVKEACKGLMHITTDTIMVVAPHQDDEVLGCGGLMLEKIDAGAKVSVVFICDGRKSHARYMGTQELTALRKKEAGDALKCIGLNEEDIYFLDYPDGELSLHYEDAIKRLKAIIEKIQPAEVFAPYSRDVHPDHEFSNRIVKESIIDIKCVTKLFEYPIWYWSHWPWISMPISVSRSCTKHFLHSMKTFFGREAVRLFTRSLLISEVMTAKKKALSCYKSQMTRLTDNIQWPILTDVSDGEWLSLFFSDYEYFHEVEIEYKERNNV